MTTAELTAAADAAYDAMMTAHAAFRTLSAAHGTTRPLAETRPALDAAHAEYKRLEAEYKRLDSAAQAALSAE